MNTYQRLRILVVDEEFPYPPNSGKRIRTTALVTRMAARHEVSYLAYSDGDDSSIAALASTGITCHPVPAPERSQSGLAFYARLLANLFSPLPYIVSSHYTSRFSRHLQGLVQREHYDLVLYEWTPYAVYARDLPGVRSLISAHNIESDIWRRYETQETNPARRAYISIQRRKVEAFERQCFKWVHGAFAVSDPDAQRIADYGVSYPVQVIENGVDLGYFTPTTGLTEPDTLVFSGSMDWRPNQDAVEHFVRDILPLIRKVRPSIQLVVVGRKPPKRIEDLARLPGVTVTGTVDDVRPYIAKAALYVVPLRIGGGSRLKILEAMAMQKPVLSTTIGAEGLAVTNGKDIVIADRIEEFAQAVLRCLDSQVHMDQIAAAGRRLVEERYGWDSLSDKLCSYLGRLTDLPIDPAGPRRR